MEHQGHRDEVARCNGLQGVGINLHGGGVQSEQVALHDHAEQEKQEEAPHGLAVGVTEGDFAAQVAGIGERHRDTAHKEEERHDEIPQAESLPHLVIEVVEHGGGTGRADAGEQIPQDGLQKDQQEEVQAAQDVE